MGMGDDQRLDRLVAQRMKHRVDMFSDIGTRIDDGYLAVADDIGAGAMKGERARIARDDPPDIRRYRLQHRIFEGQVADVLNGRHGGSQRGRR